MPIILQRAAKTLDEPSWWVETCNFVSETGSFWTFSWLLFITRWKGQTERELTAVVHLRDRRFGSRH